MHDEYFWKECDDAFVDLVAAIAKATGFSQDKKEFQDLAYAPLGWANDQHTIRKLYSLLIDVFENRRPIPVTNFINAAVYDPFPPSPHGIAQSNLNGVNSGPHIP